MEKKNALYTLWVDRQKRPCIGSTETSAQRAQRKDLTEDGIAIRLDDIVNQLKSSSVKLVGSGIQVWYNAAHQRSEAFHMKATIAPEIFLKTFLVNTKIKHDLNPKDFSVSELKMRFHKDYYADRLDIVLSNGEKISDSLIRAKKEHILGCGAVLGSTVGNIPVQGFTSALLDKFEADIRAMFAGGKSESDFWFSVCISPVTEETFCLGALIDETDFARVLLDGDLKSQFLNKWGYVPPKRTYHKDFKRTEKRNRKTD